MLNRTVVIIPSLTVLHSFSLIENGGSLVICFIYPEFPMGKQVIPIKRSRRLSDLTDRSEKKSGLSQFLC